jgi:hypothetical protein
MWPEAEENVDALTEAFEKARYSREAIREEEVSLVRRQWKRLKSSLRQGKRRETDA